MKGNAYGYAFREESTDVENNEDHFEMEEPLKLTEVTLSAQPEQLRLIAQFILSAANSLSAHGPRFGHAHLIDWQRKRGLDLALDFDVIVYNPSE